MISLIVAMANNQVMGKNNQLPWHLSEDLKYFKKITMGHSIIMGRKTFESIGKALPGRHNIVVTRDNNYVAEECIIVDSLTGALEVAGKTDELFITGGAEIFHAALPIADKLYVTRIYADIEGDTFFPEVNWADWKEVFCEKHKQNEHQGFEYAFLQYDRV